jgi:hypothetical protein
MPKMCKSLEGQAFPWLESISAASSIMIASVIKPTEFCVAKKYWWFI